MKIAILGNGYLGNRIGDINGWKVFGHRINSYRDLERFYLRYKPKVIVNAIGFTGTPNVDDCEVHIDETLKANTQLAIYFAELAFRYDVHIVHFSSGCIYKDTTRWHKESDIADYDGLLYARSKIYAEEMLKYALRQGRKISLCRIRIPIDTRSSPKNVINKLIRYKTIIDIPNSVTYVPMFADMLKFIVEKKAYGIFHTVNEGSLRYPEMMDKVRPEFKYKVVTPEQIHLKRTNLRLLPDNLKKLGYKVMTVKEMLKNLC